MRAIELCGDTAVSVAQIFSVTSRKYSPLAPSAVYSAQNRLQSHGTTRAIGKIDQNWEGAMLAVRIEKIGELAVVECEGRIVRSEAAVKLREAVTSLRNARTIVLDLSEVRAIKGGGPAMLLFLHRWADSHNIQFKLFSPARSVRDSLELANVIAELDIATFHEMMELLANADRRYARAA